VDVIDPVSDPAGFEKLLTGRLGTPQLSVIIARRPCILAAADIRHYEKQNEQKALSVVQAAQAAVVAAGCSGSCSAEEA
jgi:indolepyruvate ferredoxin oxidoreductase alpha subunit